LLINLGLTWVLFFTPVSLVQMIVNFIEPDHGVFQGGFWAGYHSLFLHELEIRFFHISSALSV